MENVKISFLELADVFKLKEWAQNPYYDGYFRRMPPLNKLSAPEVLSQWEVAWVIKVDGKTVGLINLSNFDLVNRQCEYGILVEPNVSNKAKIILYTGKSVADFAFLHLGLNKVYMRVLPGHKNIHRLNLLFGFKLEATLRSNLCWNQVYYDELIYGLLATEYYKANKPLLPAIAADFKNYNIQKGLNECIEAVTLDVHINELRYTL